MINYSATQAIGPAVERTKWFLFQPFRWGRFLKLTLVAMLTEGGMYTGSFGRSSSSTTTTKTKVFTDFQFPSSAPSMNWHLTPLLIGVGAALVCFMILVSIVISYLLIRLRFSYFDCVLRRQDQIGVAWRKYHAQAVRYLGLSLCVGLAFLACMVVLGLTLYDRFRPLIQSIGSANPPTFTQFIPLFVLAVPTFMVLVFVAVLVDEALSCFVLPHMALENASIGDAVSEVWSDVRCEPGQFILFFFLRVVLTLAASIAGVIALALPIIILGAICVAIGFMLKGVSMALTVVLAVPAAILLLGFLILGVIGVSGTIGTFRRQYALLFYGPRYPLLGEIVFGGVTPLSPPFPLGEPPIVGAPQGLA